MNSRNRNVAITASSARHPMSNSSSQATFPRSVSETLAFLEQIALELEGVANHVTSVLMQREFGGFVGVSPAIPDDDESLVAMIQSVRWTEARQRAALLTELPAEVVREVTSVLDHELTVDSIGDVRRLFRPALQSLRRESGCDYATSLPELIERLLAGPDNLVLSLQDLASLKAQLKSGISFNPKLCRACGQFLSQIDREAGRYTCYSHAARDPNLEVAAQSEAVAKQRKLATILDFNQNIADLQFPPATSHAVGESRQHTDSRREQTLEKRSGTDSPKSGDVRAKEQPPQQVDGAGQFVTDQPARPDLHNQESEHPKTTRKDRRLIRESKAIALRMAHPDWLDTQIAEAVGVHPGTLSKWTNYQSSKALAQGESTAVQKGHVTRNAESALHDVEAPTHANYCENKSDRGQPIPGSRYFREYCAECDEPIMVKGCRVGTNPICDHCSGQ